MAPGQSRRASSRSDGCTGSLVFGPRGESSKGRRAPHLARASEIGAERRWREMGARSISEAKAYIKFAMRRSIGITATRAEAGLVRERLGLLLSGAGAAAARMSSQKAWNERHNREYAEWAFGRGGRGRGH